MSRSVSVAASDVVRIERSDIRDIVAACPDFAALNPRYLLAGSVRVMGEIGYSLFGE
jgi:hypothetical protein